MIHTDVLNLFPELEEETKQCGMCKKSLPLHAFGTDGGSTYLRYECKKCAKQQANIISKLKKIAPTVSKDHICPICKRNEQEILEANPKRKNAWCIDHNHKTNTFRGYLCHKCNLGLGNFSDSIDKLNNAIKYLKGSTQ